MPKLSLQGGDDRDARKNKRCLAGPGPVNTLLVKQTEEAAQDQTGEENTKKKVRLQLEKSQRKKEEEGMPSGQPFKQRIPNPGGTVVSGKGRYA